MNKVKMDFAKLIADLSNPDKKRATAASADLASQIWAGAIDEATLIQWLGGGEEPLHATVSWSIWDFGKPPLALKTLMESGRNDANETVRLYCLRCWIEYHPKGDLRFVTISHFGKDACSTIRQRASRAMETEGSVRRGLESLER